MGRLNSAQFLVAVLSLVYLHEAASHPSPETLPLLALKVEANQTAASTCPYTVVITTSCSSISYTRDQISLSFGDAYGNQVYVPRIDNPSARTFERCSKDTFTINGPCTYDICYVYLYRRGYDGWKPGSVQIAGTYSRTATFNYNTFIPSDTWWGFNYCSGSSSQNSDRPQLLVTFLAALLLSIVLQSQFWL